MSLRMPAVALAVLVAALLTGCGQDDGTTTTVVIKTPSAATAPAVDNSANEDADAKSNARNAVTQMESCLTEDDYSTCAGNSDVTSLASASGVDAFNYILTAPSRSGNTFTIAKTGGEYERACTGSSGGCQGGSW